MNRIDTENASGLVGFALMNYLRVISVALVFSLIADFSFASDQDVGRVRIEYGGKHNTPDHLVFASTARFLAKTYEDEKDFAITIVQDNMKLGSAKDAERFLLRLIKWGEALDRNKWMLKKAIHCQDHSNRSRDDIYTIMDSLDDARVTLSNYAYQDFRKNLSNDEQRNLANWMEVAKEGYSYKSIETESLYEDRGIDIKNQLEQMCIRYEQQELSSAKR